MQRQCFMRVVLSILNTNFVPFQLRLKFSLDAADALTTMARGIFDKDMEIYSQSIG